MCLTKRGEYSPLFIVGREKFPKKCMVIKMKGDLTKGSVSKGLFAFTIPMILGNLLQQCYNLVDTWVIGNYVGANGLSAVGSAYSLMTFLNSVLIGMCMGCGAIFSYYIGKGEKKKLQQCIGCSFVLFLGISVVLWAVVQFFMKEILVGLQTPKELMDMMYQYTAIVLLGMVFLFLYNYFAFLLRAYGNSVVPLIFLGVASGINIILDLFFVIKLKWSIAGAAGATVIAQGVAAIGIMVYVWIQVPLFRQSLFAFWKSEKSFGEILRYGFASSIQQSVMNFGILMIQGLVNSFGTGVMAAMAAGVKIDTLAYMPAQEFGNAYSIFLSQNYGAGKEERMKKGNRIAFLTTIIFCGIVAGLVVFFAKPLLELFIDPKETEMIQTGIGYLHVEGMCYPLIGILFLWYGYFRGSGRPEFSLVLTIISLGLRVLIAYAFSGSFGVGAIWWSIPIGWLVADIFGIIFMHNWQKKRKS